MKKETPEREVKADSWRQELAAATTEDSAFGLAQLQTCLPTGDTTHSRQGPPTSIN